MTLTLPSPAARTASRVMYAAPYVTITYDEVQHWLYADWHGPVCSEEVMTGALRALDVLHRQPVSRVLNDNTRLCGLWADAAIWCAEELLPQLYAAGCRHLGWVYSPDIHSKLSAELLVERTAAGVTIQTFDNLQAARDWLENT